MLSWVAAWFQMHHAAVYVLFVLNTNLTTPFRESVREMKLCRSWAKLDILKVP